MSKSLPLSQDLQVLFNELQKLDRSINAKEAELSAKLLEKSRTSQYVRTKQKPKRYSVEFNVPAAASDAGGLNPITELFTVDDKTIFRPMYLDWSLRSQFFTEAGDAASTLVNVTLPFGDPSRLCRNAMFGFLLSIRDTGSNREWSNVPIPDTFLCGGILSPFYFGVGERAVLSGGTQVIFEIQPLLNGTALAAQLGIGTVVSQIAHIAMAGHEELL